MKKAQLKDFLDKEAERYNRAEFIKEDPVSVPHLFTKKEDVEIAGFLTALISWGRRPNILKAARGLMELMEMAPYEFITTAEAAQKKRLEQFVYRTFQPDDLLFLMEALKVIYLERGGLEAVFMEGYGKKGSVKEGICFLREQLLEVPHLRRSEKHLANPAAGSAAKRINMFMRWMVRSDNRGVDFGIWKSISPAHLIVPLDVHSGRVARKLGLLHRRQNDWKAADELTQSLITFSPDDPVRYDYALFGLGISGFF